ncbi:sensor histidine kinase [Chitinophaga sp. HK235]|uniref:sensor histidine kinase n=1 Tax=Chitinophaga sp. HK235 TaxID=2952571 RepID=UPI001BA64D59|nr:histidine kinase [Chitinophaga sp. HK235]
MKKQVRISPYWLCQLSGWTVAALHWEVEGFLRSPYFSYRLAILNFVADIVINILLTHAYRRFALQHRWPALPPRALILRIIPAVLLLAVCFTFTVSLRFYIEQYYPSFELSYWTYLKDIGRQPFMTGIRTMAVWVLAWHMYHYAQREIRTAQENARLQLLTREIQLSNLSAQLNPHFFFNSLNNIKSLILEDPVLARRAIDLLSELLRHALYKQSDKLIPLHEELQVVSDYLELEKLRFEDRLEADIRMNAPLSDVLVPPLSIQTMVENAIKHGINKSMDGGSIIITIEKNVTAVRITVQNPGRLEQSATSSGLGIRNLQERLQLQFHGQASFHITALPDEKVLTVLTIPVI